MLVALLMGSVSLGLAPAASAAPAAPGAAPAAKPAAAKPAAAGPAKVGSPTTTDDIRCLLTMAVLGRDPQRQQAALIGVYFFAGRLAVRAPGMDLATAIKAEEAKMAPTELPAEAQRCGPMVEAAVHGLQAAFEAPAGAKPPAAPGAAAPPAAAPPAGTPPK
ncbi:hypothetical protein [Phenylobacterium sp.]|uniref:hypothetical protein n=1 Tax=Phenylobacterium sp. TaxID=1871053 RepID=UPI00120002EF|nr:hypothetical protein [Phenylobacterium sp.]THD58277.1 MAG: hypothetical protein E8A49_20055 [Phenylobacterium sp.]